MYLNHYQLKRMPFEIGPDPRFLWLGEKHEEAFAVLQYGILESKGFIVITGEPGTGKSTLLNAAVANFGSNVRFVKISDPAMNEMDFFNFAANALGMGRRFQNKAEFLIELERFVNEAGAQLKKVVLVIDEAQRLAPERLEQIRVLSNFESPGQKVVSCIFAGQPEFLDTVRHNQALSQRIFLSHVIQPLTESEAQDYIVHRLKVAGRDEPLFSKAAIREVFRISRGNPRLINILCDQALLIGYSTHLAAIGPETVRESAKNAPIPVQAAGETGVAEPAQPGTSGPPSAADPPPAPVQAPQTSAASRRGRLYASIAAALLLALAAFAYWSGGFRTAATIPVSEAAPAAAQAPSAEAQTPDGSAARLRSELLELRREKEDVEKHLQELRTRFDVLESERQLLVESARPAGTAAARSSGARQPDTVSAAGVEELKRFRERAAQLEAEVAERDQKLARVEQRIGELEKLLARESGARNEMGAELSSRRAAIADFQNKLEAAKAAQAQLESDVQTIRSENTKLQVRIQELQAEKPTSATAPAARQAPAAAAPTASSAAAGEAPDPARAIDFLMKKKSQ
jgi:type II secretory pathway predicted ATPase ExeA/predicted  nucleic acid-binding Zn-ribbon protein